MIEINHVTKQYGKAKVLKDFTIKIEEEGIYCLLGRNGAGKTTLLKSIAGHRNITSGEILVDTVKISTASLETGVSYIENFSSHFKLPVQKLLQIARELDEPVLGFDAIMRSEFYELLLESFERHPRIISSPHIS